MTADILKSTLDNGLTVVLKETHHAPVASFFVWYRVGSRNERQGQTGISHWVEHMMFKGTPRYPNGTLDRLVSREGGQWNAFTWLDFTAYYETIAANRIELGLDIESDRMVNTIISPEETDSERTVIISERHMYENHPNFLLAEEMQAAAFRVHPYHHEVIGDEVDLITMTHEDLENHYRRYYAPNNAIAVAVGDFNTEEMLARIQEKFGDIPPGDTPEPVRRQEPPQRGERRVTVEGPGDAAYLTVSYRAPAATQSDYFPLVLFNAAFAGGSSLGFFGGSGSNKSSRLYKALVATELAAGASGSMAPTIDPYLYSLNLIARPGRSLDEIEAALDAELERVTEDPINERELQKALKQAKVQFVMAGESVTGQAQMIGLAEAVTGDYRWYENALERLAAVTLDDIERVRKEYIRPANRTVGRYLPETRS
jgi:zinc protease